MQKGPQRKTRLERIARDFIFRSEIIISINDTPELERALTQLLIDVEINCTRKLSKREWKYNARRKHNVVNRHSAQTEIEGRNNARRK